MQRITLFCSIAAIFLTACSTPVSSPSPQSRVSHQVPLSSTAVNGTKMERFHTTMIQVAQSTKQDPNYHRIALNTQEEKIWFRDLMYKLWDREITRQQFIAEGVKRYPSHRYEFTYIANAYQNY